MSIHRRAARRDANEQEIVKALRDAGCLVEPISGKGVPDLLVWSPFRRCILLLEVKDGAKPPSARKLKPAQVEFHRMWSDAPVFVVESAEDAVLAVRAR